MANICESTISVVGLKEAPETFVKSLSKAMFGIDLDNMELEGWGNYRCEDGKLISTYRAGDKVYRSVVPDSDVDPCQLLAEGRWYEEAHRYGSKAFIEITPATWYSQILKEGRRHSPLCVLIPDKPFVKCGVEVPRFYIETKWEPPMDAIKKASQAFPDLLFHVRYWVEPDGPTGEFVFRNGRWLESTENGASWYLFDKLKYPSMSLLPKYMPLTLAQRGAAAIEDAIERIKMVHSVLHSSEFTDSRYRPYGDQRKVEETTKAIDALLGYMEEAGKALTFEGVFLPDIPMDEMPEQSKLTEAA